MENFDAIDELLEKARIDYENNKPADDDPSVIQLHNVMKCIEVKGKSYGIRIN